MDTWAGQAANWTWNNGQDVARIGFRIFDLVLGGGMIWTGVGTLPGIGLIAIGLDQIATGSINIRYGRVNQGFSILEFGVYRATGSETAAILAPGLFSLGFGSWGSLARLGARGAGAVFSAEKIANRIAPGVIEIGHARNLEAMLQGLNGTKIIYNSSLARRIGRNWFDYKTLEIHFNTSIRSTGRGVFYEEVQHALDFYKRPGWLAEGFLGGNKRLHAGTFIRLSANSLFELSAVESAAFFRLGRDWARFGRPFTWFEMGIEATPGMGVGPWTGRINPWNTGY